MGAEQGGDSSPLHNAPLSVPCAQGFGPNAADVPSGTWSSALLQKGSTPPRSQALEPDASPGRVAQKARPAQGHATQAQEAGDTRDSERWNN